MPPGHLGRCRTTEGVAKAYARNVARHKRVVTERHLWLDQYKLKRGCVDCGYKKAAVALDFDHRDPELKVANIAAMLWKNIALIETEIAKCDIRCANCHRIKTQALDQNQNRRRPAPDADAQGGPTIEISDHLPVSSSQLVHLRPPPRIGLRTTA